MTKNLAQPPLFGAAAVHLGFISADHVEQVLSVQARERSQGLTSSPIGSLLLDRGLLTSRQISAVLRHMAGIELPLSEEGIRLAARLKVVHAAAGNVIGFAGTVGEDAAVATTEVAVAMAVMEQGQVLAVDANLRAPTLHRLLGTPAAPGFIDAIQHGVTTTAALVTKVDALSVVPAGQSDIDFVSACMSPEAAAVIDRYRSQHRYTLVHLGDVLRHPEAAVTASRCDGVVVVLRGGVSQKGELRDMQRMLLGLQTKISGVVLARVGKRQDREQPDG